MNPCPCGYYGDPVRECTCSMGVVSKYQKRISRPLLDRIDIHYPSRPQRSTVLIHHGVYGSQVLCCVSVRMIS